MSCTFYCVDILMTLFFDDFLKVSEHFPKISEDFPKLFRRPEERSQAFSENFRRLPKTLEEDPKILRSYTNEFKQNSRDKLISVISSIYPHRIRHSSPGCSFV